MAEYYTKPESDALFAPMDHDHNLEELGGTELPASRVAVPESVSSSFDDAFTMDEALASAASQLAGKANANHTHSGYAAASHTHSGYAPATHEHTEYADAEHTHTPAAIGAAEAAHTHDYAASDHAHTEYSPTSHTHTPAAIGAAPATHTHDYAAPTHSHAQSEITGLTDALAAKANASAMSGKADLVDGKVPASQLPGYVDDVVEYAAVSNFPATGEAGKIYVATGTNKNYRWSGSTYVEVAGGVALGETSGTAYRGDRGKTAYDHSQNSTVHVTASQKTAWDSKAAGNHTHSEYAASGHTHTASEVGAAAATHSHTPASIGAAASSHTHSGYAASNHTHSGYASSSHGHTASEVGAVPASGGTATNLTVTPYLYTAQILPKDGGSYSIGASDNRYYSTYLRVNPNVSSDRRCKRDIAPMDINALAAFVGKLSVVNYNYNDDAADEAKRIGLIAQDVVAADPTIAQGCIEQDEKGFYSLRAADLVFPLIAAVQVLTKRVEELEGK